MSRSVSTGGISNRAKEELAEMNGPALPEKVLKSMQVNVLHKWPVHFVITIIFSLPSLCIKCVLAYMTQ